jgi:hypothetical protein
MIPDQMGEAILDRLAGAKQQRISRDDCGSEHQHKNAQTRK